MHACVIAGCVTLPSVSDGLTDSGAPCMCVQSTPSHSCNDDVRLLDEVATQGPPLDVAGVTMMISAGTVASQAISYVDTCMICLVCMCYINAYWVMVMYDVKLCCHVIAMYMYECNMNCILISIMLMSAF